MMTLKEAKRNYAAAKAAYHGAIEKALYVGLAVRVHFSNGRQIEGVVAGHAQDWTEPGRIRVRNSRTGKLRTVYLSIDVVEAMGVDPQ